MGNCTNKIEISAPVEAVWDKIKDFHDLSWASGVIEKLDKVGDKNGSQVGAKRVLNDAFHESLLSIDHDGFTFTYSIDDGPGPIAKDVVSNYKGVVTLSPAGNGTLVEWNSSYESKADSEVADFCNPIYQALLGAMKKSF
ncbi:MAG: SRPBCC family protein [Bermanella sp.]